jgi:O-methyltransferase
VIAQDLLQKYPIISQQVTRERLAVVLGACEDVLRRGVPGDIVEFGCYVGTTSLFLRRMMDAYDQSDKRELHVYDSFEGLPEKHAQDASPAGEQFRAGELTTSKKQLLREFQRANLKPPIIHKGWFDKLTPADVPNHISFAFLDGDFYSSILDSLKLTWPALGPNGVIAIDDYGREALPGPEKAVRDFLRHKQYKNLRAEQNIALLKP